MSWPQIAVQAAATIAPYVLKYFQSKGQQQGMEGFAEQMPSVEKEIRQAGAQAIGRLDPYAQAGTQSLPLLQQSLAQGADPTKLLSQYSSQFQLSPFAQTQIQEAQKAAENIGAAGGVVGSGAQQRALAQEAQQVTSGDLQKYLGNVIGLRQQYLGGLEDLTGRGQQAAALQGQFGMMSAQDIANLLGQMYAAQGQGEEAGESGMGSLLSGGLAAFGKIGGMFGGKSGGKSGGSSGGSSS